MHGWRCVTVGLLQVPQAMWEDGILTGYRRPDKPWDYYARSVLWMHNETVYIWGLVLSTSEHSSVVVDPGCGGSVSMGSQSGMK